MKSYFGHLALALPVLAFQLVALFALRRREYGAVLRAVVPPALAWAGWYVLADQVGTALGVWRFDERALVGVKLGVVPIEEVAFFLLTSLLVALGFALFRLGRRAARP